MQQTDGLNNSFFNVGFPASDSSAAASDGETITLNSGALQTFEILPVRV